MNIMKLQAILSVIQQKRVIIARERDELWALCEQIGDILEPLDEGIAEIEEGIHLIHNSIKSLSKIL